MAKYTRFINNDQWKLLEPLLPKAKRSAKGGRPPIENLEVLEGILWVLRTGAPWKDMPPRYPPYQTCHRWFQTWVRQGVFKQILTELGEDLYRRGAIDIRESIIYGSFTPTRSPKPRMVAH